MVVKCNIKCLNSNNYFKMPKRAFNLFKILLNKILRLLKLCHISIIKIFVNKPENTDIKDRLFVMLVVKPNSTL